MARTAAVLLIVAGAISFANPAQAQTITGAGATFIGPIMTRWITAYKASTGVDVNYQPIGSGGGISALISKTVDFAASDVPLKPEEKKQAGAPIVDIPEIIGAVVVAYHIPGVGPGIALTGPVIADIYEGKITYWDDPKITALSPGTKFPHTEILVVHRSDGSGTTAIFTDYLSKVSPTWQSTVGSGKSVNWPIGLGGKGNPGVANYLTSKPGSIGYVELAFAIQNNIPYAKIQNKAGKWIYPSVASASAAADGIVVPANLEVSITDSPNKKAYPIAGLSNLIIYTKSANNAKVQKFFQWILTEGQKPEFTAPENYAPLPKNIRNKDLAALKTIE